jgi:hypothetical protein
MHLRALAASPSFDRLALAPLVRRCAALADELAEVTRLHHAGQSHGGARARRPLPRRQAEGCADALPEVGRARRFGPAQRGGSAARADLAGLPELPSRTTTSPRSMPPPAITARRGPSWEESIRLNPGYATRTRISATSMAMLAAEAYGRRSGWSRATPPCA